MVEGGLFSKKKEERTERNNVQKGALKRTYEHDEQDVGLRWSAAGRVTLSINTVPVAPKGRHSSARKTHEQKKYAPHRFAALLPRGAGRVIFQFFIGRPAAALISKQVSKDMG
jgi:hypothetical protein